MKANTNGNGARTIANMTKSFETTNSINEECKSNRCIAFKSIVFGGTSVVSITLVSAFVFVPIVVSFSISIA